MKENLVFKDIDLVIYKDVIYVNLKYINDFLIIIWFILN